MMASSDATLAVFSPSQLYASILKFCSERLAMAAPFAHDAEHQIDYLLSGDHEVVNFTNWLRCKVTPTAETFVKSHSSKDIAIAKHYKQLADIYVNTAEPQLQDKLLHSLNMVSNRIIY